MSYFGSSASGYSGYSGSAGATGTSGFSGYSGKSGFSGSNGSTGTSGFSGYSGQNGSASGGGITWAETSAPSVQLNENEGWIPNRPTPITFNMPVAAEVGSVVAIAGKGAGGWRIQMNEGQQTFSSNFGSTMPDGGIDSSNQYDCAELICITDGGAEWVLRNYSGNLTFS